MIKADHVTVMYKRNLSVAKMQIEGLSEEDCLLQPEFRGNCINWIFGHMLSSRQSVLKELGKEPVIDPKKLDPYIYDSEPLSDETEGILSLEELLSKLAEAQEALEEALSSVDENDWTDKVINERGTKLWARVEFLNWHETYHLGQLEYLRQITGKDDKVI